MRVVTQDAFGGPDVLHMADRPLPEPGPTEIRVRVRAAGVNPVDLGTRSGRGVADVVGDPPFVLGWDVSGVVDAVAPGVTRFSVGDEVFGMPWFPRQAGTHAEFVVAPARHFAAKPAALDHDQAGGLALAGLTSWQVLVDTAGLQAGQRVLVHGAGGGVGHVACQVALALGAEVVGTASPGKHAALADLGVLDVVDHAVRFESAAAVDLVVDLIGGDQAVRLLDALRPGGLLVHVPSDVLPEGLGEAAAARGVAATSFLVEPDHAGLEHLAMVADAGRLRVLVAGRFPLEQAARAHEVLATGRPLGKVVLTTTAGP